MRRSLVVGVFALLLLCSAQVFAAGTITLTPEIPAQFLWDDNGTMKIRQGEPFYIEIFWNFEYTGTMLGGSFDLEMRSDDIATVTKIAAPAGTGRTVLTDPMTNVALKNGFNFPSTYWTVFGGTAGDEPFAFYRSNFDGTLPDIFGHAFATTGGFPGNLGKTAFYEIHYQIDAPGTFCVDTAMVDASFDWAFGDDAGGEVTNNMGDFPFCWEVKDPALDVRQQNSELLPVKFALEQNHPNPFNPSTVIEFALPQASMTNLSIYNILGQRISTLVDKELPAGFYQVTWDGTTDNGTMAATGIYFYRIEADKFQSTKKLMLLK